MNEHVTEVAGDENVVSANNADLLKQEALATAQAILDKEEGRKQTVKEINTEITKLKKRFKELHQAIKDGGLQQSINWGAVPAIDNKPAVIAKRGRKPKTETLPS